MSYRCKTCNKELEDYILVCDNCGTKKSSIKIQETKKEVTEEEKKEDDSENKTVMILTSIIIMFLSAGVIVYGFFNYTSLGSLFTYLGIAFFLVILGKIAFPKSVILKVLFYTELYLFFGIITIPIQLLMYMIKKF